MLTIRVQHNELLESSISTRESRHRSCGIVKVSAAPNQERTMALQLLRRTKSNIVDIFRFNSNGSYFWSTALLWHKQSQLLTSQSSLIFLHDALSSLPGISSSRCHRLFATPSRSISTPNSIAYSASKTQINRERLSEYGIDSSNLGKISCQEHGPSSWECISQVMWSSHEISSHAVLERVLEGLILWTIPIVIVSLVDVRRKWRSYCWQQTALSILLHVVQRGAKWIVPTNQWRRISCLFSECRRGRGWPCWLWGSWLICSAPQHVPCTNLPVFSY